MGRKENRQLERRKENRKKLKDLDKEIREEETDMSRLIKIFCGVIAVLVILYFVFAFFNGELFKKTEKTPEVIQDVVITAGTTFAKDQSEYYVLFYDFDGDNKVYCDSLKDLYGVSSHDEKMYTVNLGSGLNKSYVTTDVSQVNTSNPENLKVVDATLIKVKDGKAVETIAGKDKLVAYEKTLLK